MNTVWHRRAGDADTVYRLPDRAASLVLATSVNEAIDEAFAAAATLASSAKEGRPALVVDFRERRGPAAGLYSTEMSRGLVELLRAGFSDLNPTARGPVCHLTLSPDEEGVSRIEPILKALPQATVCFVVVPVALFRDLLAEHGPVHPDVARRLAENVRGVLAVDGVAADVTEAHEAEGMGRGQFEVGVLFDPTGQLRGHLDSPPDVSADALHPERSDHKPQLEGPEPPSEGYLPVPVVDHCPGGSRLVLEVLGQDGQRLDQLGPIGDIEGGAVEVGQHPLVGVERVAVDQLGAPGAGDRQVVGLLVATTSKRTQLSPVQALRPRQRVHGVVPAGALEDALDLGNVPGAVFEAVVFDRFCVHVCCDAAEATHVEGWNAALEKRDLAITSRASDSPSSGSSRSSRPSTSSRSIRAPCCT